VRHTACAREASVMEAALAVLGNSGRASLNKELIAVMFAKLCVTVCFASAFLSLGI
jgi:hypothetical protein